MTCLSIAALLFMTTLKTEAQKKAEFGVRFMPTFTAFDVESSSGGTVEGEVTLGYGGGAFFGFNFNNYIGVQAEVIYTSTSQTFKDNANELKVDLKYVSIPLLLSLNTGKHKTVNFNIVGGPQLGLNAGSKINSSSNDGTGTVTTEVTLKKGDIGFAYGAGIDVGLNTAKTLRLGIGYRGVYGLIDISDDSKNNTTNNYYVLDRSHIVSNSAYVGISIMF